MTLAQLTGDRPFVADGGLETSLVFGAGIDLPDFAAFPLLETEDGRIALTEYYAPYLDLADQLGTGIVLDTPTWRAPQSRFARQVGVSSTMPVPSWSARSRYGA